MFGLEVKYLNVGVWRDKIRLDKKLTMLNGV